MRERQRRRTQHDISTAALELFERHGVEGTTVDDIAAAAEVSPRTFFRHFATKEDAALLIHRDFAEALESRLGDGDSRAPHEVLAQVYAEVLESYGDGSSPEAQTMMRVRRLMAANPVLNAAGLRLDAEQSRRLVEHIARATGTDPDLDLEPRLAVETLAAAVRVTLEVWTARIEAGRPSDARALFAQALKRLGV
ncbi:TetR/AcrR family transcriptional regulator [Amycolatopsis sp. 3B14]|uniref:TetR/AcrR family transcriptional regulator n=1 Tax=Amycolatopsis sp. 3B14 TaxID=3243600 RepID=UPI003D97A0DE